MTDMKTKASEARLRGTLAEIHDCLDGRPAPAWAERLGRRLEFEASSGNWDAARSARLRYLGQGLGRHAARQTKTEVLAAMKSLEADLAALPSDVESPPQLRTLEENYGVLAPGAGSISENGWTPSERRAQEANDAERRAEIERQARAQRVEEAGRRAGIERAAAEKRAAAEAGLPWWRKPPPGQR